MQCSRLIVLLAVAAASKHKHCRGCEVSEGGGKCTRPRPWGPAFLQFKSEVQQTLVASAGSCAPFAEWPDVDGGITCGSCRALVKAEPYGGRCDRYCESFGHRCTAAAEERAENCEVLEEKRCDESISGTSDILCTCEREGTPTTPGCFGELPGLAQNEGGSVGQVSTSSASECQNSCEQNPACNSVSFCREWGCFLKDRSFTGTEATQQKGSCRTFFKMPCSVTTTPKPASTTSTPPPTEPGCFGELPGLAQNEGGSVGQVSTSSASECQSSCEQNPACNSVSFCREWGCFLKDRSFTGTEATTQKGSCRTFFKMPCSATTPMPSSTSRSGQFKLRVVSYNLYWWNAFGQNPWKGEQIIDNIRERLAPSAIGLQECDSPSRIQESTGLAQASTFAGAQGVMMDPSQLRVVAGTSGSQDLQATGKWGPRHVTWVQLADRATGRTFWHFNTHWCVHSGNGRTCNAEVRYTGAKNMLTVIREKAGNSPVVVTGDFNANMNEQGPQHFLQNGFRLAVVEWVDAIFYSEHWNLVSQGSGDAAGSDHRPVFAELELL
ncbi:unnamed protein product [Symbiodinium natans]|uniref:Apple domain-containing protein n=1 Tax=Symbiodinium natans TaxID=878477 RepID=A0A812GEI2_9DINO|nr:unnamed protein product [Symbiodinium natans]